jgi:hypothetical protein
MSEFDFFDTPIQPYTVLKDRAELDLHIRDTSTMEQRAVRAVVATSMDKLPRGEGAVLNLYGRLGERIRQQWYIHILGDLEEDALGTDHEMAQSLDIEHSMESTERFKESKYRKPKGS